MMCLDGGLINKYPSKEKYNNNGDEKYLKPQLTFTPSLPPPSDGIHLLSLYPYFKCVSCRSHTHCLPCNQ